MKNVLPAWCPGGGASARPDVYETPEAKSLSYSKASVDTLAVAKPKATIQDVADHIDHAAKVAGVDHVGIGSDVAGVGMPEGLEDTSRYPYLFAELLKRGWKATDLQKLAGRNLVRAMAQAEAVAARLQKERPAGVATFEGLDGAKR